jgi:hypothetical protein
MRIWTRLLPAVLLALFVFGTSLRAIDPAETNSEKIEKLQKEMKQIREDVQKLKNDMAMNSVRGGRVEEQLDLILRRLDSLAQQQQSTIQRISAYGPTAIPGNAPPPAGATITVENRYPGDAQVRINGQAYTVRPFQTIQVPRISAGTFEYSVEVNGLLIQPPRTETLPPTGYRITVFPQMPL